MIFLAVPEKPGDRPQETLSDQFSGTVGVYASPVFWRLALGTTLFQGINMSVQGLWAGPWLADVAGFGRQAVAFHLLVLGVAAMCGFLFWGALAARLARRGTAPMSVLIAASAIYLLIQLLFVFGSGDLALPMWVGWGFFGTSGSLSFAILSQNFPISLSGRATTALNLLVFMTAFASQWGFGAIVNHWPAESGGYQAEGYAVAFGIFFVLQLCGFIWLVIARRH
jgi:predicted MFS family arabinose efflux permease